MELAQDQIRDAVISSLDSRTKPGHFTVRRLSNSERVLAGLKWWGISWAIALAFVPFPGFHFVLPPLFLALGPVAFIVGFRARLRIENGRSNCPNCGAVVEFSRNRYRERFKDRCPTCLHEIYVAFESVH